MRDLGRTLARVPGAGSRAAVRSGAGAVNLRPVHRAWRSRGASAGMRGRAYFNGGQFEDTVMHWRKVPDKTDGKVFYVVVSVLLASLALTTTLLILHFHT
jgi:hypothetical protein